VAGSESVGCPRLWISYPWIASEERDFRYLIPQLKDTNIEAVYDSFQLMPDTCLWQKIVSRLATSGLMDGCMCLLINALLAEIYGRAVGAIDQTRLRIAPDFPIAGLLYGITPSMSPLRSEPCRVYRWAIQTGNHYCRES